MNSHITAQFRKRFEELPEDVQHAAEEAYRTWQRDPFHPSLHFKEIRAGIWSVRIGLHCVRSPAGTAKRSFGSGSALTQIMTN